MAKVKEINGRIINKHDIEVNWNKASTFIPEQGEIIIYDIDENYNFERFKIGDGITNVINLPFINIELDTTLLVEGKAADAKAVGDALALKADATEILQPDWNQNDSTSNDYIKNRTHYLVEISSLTSDVLEECTTGLHLLVGSISSYNLEYLAYDKLTRHDQTYVFSYEFEAELTAGWTQQKIYLSGSSSCKLIDDKNYKRSVNSARGITLYIIVDLSTLTAENAQKFTQTGVYFERTSSGNDGMRNFQFICEKPKRFNKTYLPVDTVYTSDLATVATTGDYNDLLNVPEIATDDEIIEMLAQEDTLPVVTDSDGSILADENENILLW